MDDQQRGAIWEMLKLADQALLKMIAGMIRFVVRVIPRMLAEFVNRWVPVFVKSIQVAGLGIVFLLMLFGPSYFLFRVGNYILWLKVAAFGWIAVALSGCAWGLYKWRHRDRRLVATVWDALSARDDEVIHAAESPPGGQERSGQDIHKTGARGGAAMLPAPHGPTPVAVEPAVSERERA